MPDESIAPADGPLVDFLEDLGYRIAEAFIYELDRKCAEDGLALLRDVGRDHRSWTAGK